MSALLLNPHYCPEDKDILDFINSITISVDDLTNLLRHRGVYISKNAKKPDLVNLLIKEIYTWADVTELLALLTIPTQKEHYITGNHTCSADFDVLEQAVSLVKEFRLTKYGDRVNIESVEEGIYRIAIDYTKIDYEKTRLIQCVEREAEIFIEKTDTGFKTRRTDNDRASEIELAILGEYEKLAAEDNHELKSIRLRLSEIKSVQRRVAFFTDLMEGLAGYDFEQIKTARAQSFKDPSQSVDMDDGDELADEYKSVLESLVFNGKNVGGTEIYDSVIGKDFFTASATWTVVSDTDECRKVEVKAAFVPVLDDFEIQFSVLSVWMFKSGELQPKTKANQFQKARFANLLIESAEAAYAKAIA